MRCWRFPGGWLADRFGPRLADADSRGRVVVVAHGGDRAGFDRRIRLAVLRAVSVPQLSAKRGCFLNLSRAFSRWLPQSWRGNAFGLVIMSALIGGAVTQKLTAKLLVAWNGNWRAIFLFMRSRGLSGLCLWFWWFRDDPHTHPSVNEAELKLIGTPPPMDHPPVPWKDILTNRSMLLLSGMYFGVIYGWYFFLTWLPKYLLKARGFDLASTGSLAMLPLLAMALGVAVAGWVSDALIQRIGRRWGRRIPRPHRIAIGSGVVGRGHFTGDCAKTSAYLFAVAAGLATFGVAPGWAACLDIGGRHAGVVTGVMNTFGNLGGTVMPLLMGLCLQWWNSWNASFADRCIFLSRPWQHAGWASRRMSRFGMCENGRDRICRSYGALISLSAEFSTKMSPLTGLGVVILPATTLRAARK